MEAFSKLLAYSSQDDETTAVKPPAEFSPGSKWKPFKEGAIAFFNSQRGRGPILYAKMKYQTPMTYMKMSTSDLLL